MSLLMIRLRFDPVVSGNHRAKVVPEAGDDYLKHVNDHEEHQRPGNNEMDRPYGLPAEKDIHPAGVQCVQRRRHTQSHQDHQGEKEEDHRQIGEFLQHVVVLGRLTCGVSKAQMIDDRSAYGTPILPRGKQDRGANGRSQWSRSQRRCRLPRAARRKRKCQRRAMASHSESGMVSQDGNSRTVNSPSGPLEAPRNPVVLKSWPKMRVTPEISPLSSSWPRISNTGGTPL